MHDVRNRIGAVEGLIEDLDRSLDPAIRPRVQEMLRLLLDLHAEGLEQLLGRLEPAVIREIAREETVAALLLLHGLHPESLESRIRSALESVKPYLASHGGNVELVSIDDAGVLRLRLEGSCHGCPSSSATLKSTIERAIHDAAPDVAEIVVEGSDRPVEEAAR
jgi:Fe-S cluster biogenesis protein NfuA